MNILDLIADKRPAPRVEPRVGYSEQGTAFDDDARGTPCPPSVPRDRTRELEDAVAKLSAELTMRCTQVADLCNAKQQQATELLSACDEIDRLSKSIDALHDALARHEDDGAASKDMIIRLGRENSELRQQLNKALKDPVQLMQRLLGAETALNDREVAIVATQERYAEMRAELAEARSEAARLAAAVDAAERRHHGDVDRQIIQLKIQIKVLEEAVADRDAKVEEAEMARLKFANRCDEFARIVHNLKSEQESARKNFVSDAVESLETLMKVERQSADAKIKALTAELRSERLKQAGAKPDAETERDNTVVPLTAAAASRNRAA